MYTSASCLWCWHVWHQRDRESCSTHNWSHWKIYASKEWVFIQKKKIKKPGNNTIWYINPITIFKNSLELSNSKYLCVHCFLSFNIYEQYSSGPFKVKFSLTYVKHRNPINALWFLFQWISPIGNSTCQDAVDFYFLLKLILSKEISQKCNLHMWERKTQV